MKQIKTKILVIYIGVAGIRNEDIENYVHKITKKITPQSFNGEIIIIPIQSYDTRIECINPQYITKVELVKKHNEMIKCLQEELQNQLDQFKLNKNE